MPDLPRTCSACSDSFTAHGPWAGQTRYCFRCRLLRDWEVDHGLKHFSASCPLCGAEHFPIRRTWAICASCEHMAEDPAEQPECGVCGEQNVPAPCVSGVCQECVQRTQQNRASFYAGLYRQVRGKRLTPAQRRAAKEKSATSSTEAQL